MRRLLPCSLLPLLTLACVHDARDPDPDPAPSEAQAEPEQPEPSPLRARLEAMLAAEPEHAVVLYVLARSAATRGEADEALTYLERLVAIDTWDYPLERADFGALSTDPRFVALADALAARAPAVERGRVALELPALDLLPEGIAWDAAREQLLVGSMHQRKILALTPAGVVRELVAPQTAGLLGVLGIEVDGERELVWAAGAAAPFIADYDASAGSPGGIWAFDLSTGEHARTVLAADNPVQLNDLTVVDGGRVVVTDSLNHRLLLHDPTAPAEAGFEVLVDGDALLAPNGVVAAPGGEAVYVADFSGLHRVELDGGALERLTPPAGVATLGGIDGLDRRGDTLVGVQNLFCPGRVWALRVSDDGRSLVDARILDDSHPRLQGPTTGAFIDDQRYWYLANAALQFGPQGMQPAPEGARHAIIEVGL